MPSPPFLFLLSLRHYRVIRLLNIIRGLLFGLRVMMLRVLMMMMMMMMIITILMMMMMMIILVW